MTLPTDLPEKMRRALAALRGLGYSQLESSYVQRENHAHAHAAAMGSATLLRAWMEGTGRFSDQTLTEWEAVLGLPNDAPRTNLERAVRVQLVRAVPAAEMSVDALESLLRIVAPSATVLTNTAARLACDRPIVEDHFACLCALSDADYDDGHVRGTVAEVMRRAAPFRCRQPSDPDDMVATGYELRWGDVFSFFDRDAVRQTAELAAGAEAVDNLPESARYGRVVSYTQLTKLRSDDWNRLQDATLYARSNQASGVTLPVGQVRVVFAGSITASTSKIVDATADWRERMVLGAVAVSGSDLRPGGAADTTAIEGHNVYLFAGPGGAPSQLTYTTDQRIGVDAANGDLLLFNDVAATRYYVAIIYATEAIS